MELLKEKIRLEGKVLPGEILKIDNFLNHQIDTRLMDEIGKEFYELFKDSNPDKLLTIESSGIAIAYAASRHFDYIPIIFAKKRTAANMAGDIYTAKERSYTRDIEYTVHVAKDYLHENDRVLILDDFLANGEAMQALISICKQAKTEIVGCGAVVCKVYQPGLERIKDLGYDVKILAGIKSMSDDGQIEFVD